MKVTAKIRYDFSCDYCLHWWSVIDMAWQKGVEVTCPHCKQSEQLPDNPMLKPDFCIDTNQFRQSIKDAGFSNLYELMANGEIRAVPEGMAF